MKDNALKESLLELVRRTSTDLAKDVRKVIFDGLAREEPGSRAHYAMKVIADNIALAEKCSQPLCQDTGVILFFVDLPEGFNEARFKAAGVWAVRAATKKGYLRQNSVDPLTGVNSGDNTGPGSPVFHIHRWNKKDIRVRLVLKGGGSENVGVQYSLPDSRLGAGRDLAGVRKCLLDTVFQAQGKGCGPGVLGVCIGGDRATAYAFSKEQFLRRLDDRNPLPELADLESRILEEANRLGIGPMGFGGKTTLLGVKIGFQNRLPACFFVSVSYVCWACRRQGATLESRGKIKKWLY